MLAADTDQLDADAGLLADVVREAGRLAVSLRKKGLEARRKPDGSLVTNADEAVDRFLRETIRQARPDDGWLSEETPDDSMRLECSRLWVFDPIDGTTSFHHGSSSWCIGGALVVDGKPVVSVIFQPDIDTVFSARRERGCQRNGDPLRMTGSMEVRAVIAPRSMSDALSKLGLEARPGGGLPLLLRLAGVAQGSHAGAVSLGRKHDWDIAAGHLLVTEAGGLISTQTGGEMIYNLPLAWQPGLVAAAPQWHQPILTCTRDI